MINFSYHLQEDIDGLCMAGRTLMLHKFHQNGKLCVCVCVCVCVCMCLLACMRVCVCLSVHVSILYVCLCGVDA